MQSCRRNDCNPENAASGKVSPVILFLARVPRELVGTTGAERYTLAWVCLRALALLSCVRCSLDCRLLHPRPVKNMPAWMAGGC